MKPRFAPRHVAIGVVLTGLTGAVYLAAQPRIRTVQTRKCEANLKQVGNAMSIYIRDYDEKLPKADNWSSALKPYVIGFGARPSDPEAVFRQWLKCPTTGSFYVYNRNIAGRSYTSVDPKTTPWIYETGAGQNQLNVSDNGKLWPALSVHEAGGQRGTNALFDAYQVALIGGKPAFRTFPIPTPRPKPALLPKSKAKGNL